MYICSSAKYTLIRPHNGKTKCLYLHLCMPILLFPMFIFMSTDCMDMKINLATGGQWMMQVLSLDLTIEYSV